MHDLETRIVAKARAGHSDRRLILVEGQQTTIVAERIEDTPAVPAATEGAVYIDAAGTNRQRGHRFVEHDRDMRIAGDHYSVNSLS